MKTSRANEKRPSHSHGYEAAKASVVSEAVDWHYL